MSFGSPGSAPSAFPGHRPPLPNLPVLRSPRGLATALTALLSVCAGVNLLSAGVGVYTWSLTRVLTGDPVAVRDDALRRSGLLSSMTGSFQMLSLLATGVVFIIWFHRVRTNGQVLLPGGFSQSRGWAIGGWFVPFGNLYLPYRIAKETWRAAGRPDQEGSGRRASTAPVTAWWLVWVGSTLCDAVVEQLYKRVETPEALGIAAGSGAFADLITAAAAVLAVLFVRRLTALQHTRAMSMYAAV
ncbi:DUF4328 domain-containing protein [Streptomyces sp. NPDC089915]|uniref:DUF4328 domain-containing protein n=1 Tax=Streptomyces sp. NPDC089915 TaxID=3155186 RepID=UPI00344407CE